MDVGYVQDRNAERSVKPDEASLKPHEFINKLLNDLKTNRLKLPSLPDIGLKVQQAVDHPHASSRQVADIVIRDPAVAARLIQVANSPMFRGVKTIEDVQSAVTRLGMGSIKNVVMTLIMKQLFKADNPALAQKMKGLWEHSTQVAAISTLLARRHSRLSPDEALLAGLVHDIGELPVIGNVVDYPEIAANDEWLGKIRDKVSPIIGRTILKVWKFPDSIVQVAAEHENIYRDSEKLDLVDIVIAANLHVYIGTNHPLDKVNWAEVPAIKKLNLEPDQSIELIKAAKQDIEAMQRALSL